MPVSKTKMMRTKTSRTLVLGYIRILKLKISNRLSKFKECNTRLIKPKKFLKDSFKTMILMRILMKMDLCKTKNLCSTTYFPK
jgi:hypothetical protein